MVCFQKISNLDLPELEPYRTLKRSAAHEKLGIFVVEGDKVLHRLLDSHFTVISVLLTEERVAEFEPRLKSRPENEITAFVCPKHVMAQLTGFDIYQGVLAIARIPHRKTLDDLYQQSPAPRLFVALDGLSNAENVGLLMRNCAAFGVHALIAGETTSSLFLRRTVRNSMGTLFKLPTLESQNLVETLHQLRARGMRCIAAHPHTEEKHLSQTDLSGDCCIVFGSEGDGISPGTLAACDECAAIPMADGIDSLNVSAAAAVFLYEAVRRRRKT